MTETEDAEPANDPNTNTIFTVCVADDLGRLTSDGWVLDRHLGWSPNDEARCEFLLSRTRDVDNAQRANEAEAKVAALQIEVERLRKECSQAHKEIQQSRLELSQSQHR